MKTLAILCQFFVSILPNQQSQIAELYYIHLPTYYAGSKFSSCHSEILRDDISCNFSPLRNCQIIFRRTGFDISGKLSPKETICMKCQILFSKKIKKKYHELLSTEFDWRVIMVKYWTGMPIRKSYRPKPNSFNP